FQDFENEKTTQPNTTWLANQGGQPVAGSTTRVLASDLDQLQMFLTSKLNFDPGGYTPYDFKVQATRFIGRVDYNLNNANKVTFRYVHLDSSTDVLESNSS